MVQEVLEVTVQDIEDTSQHEEGLQTNAPLWVSQQTTNPTEALQKLSTLVSRLATIESRYPVTFGANQDTAPNDVPVREREK